MPRKAAALLASRALWRRRAGTKVSKGQKRAGGGGRKSAPSVEKRRRQEKRQKTTFRRAEGRGWPLRCVCCVMCFVVVFVIGGGKGVMRFEEAAFGRRGGGMHAAGVVYGLPGGVLSSCSYHRQGGEVGLRDTAGRRVEWGWSGEGGVKKSKNATKKRLGGALVTGYAGAAPLAQRRKRAARRKGEAREAAKGEAVRRRAHPKSWARAGGLQGGVNASRQRKREHPPSRPRAGANEIYGVCVGHTSSRRGSAPGGLSSPSSSDHRRRHRRRRHRQHRQHRRRCVVVVVVVVAAPSSSSASPFRCHSAIDADADVNSSGSLGRRRCCCWCWCAVLACHCHCHCACGAPAACAASPAFGAGAVSAACGVFEGARPGGAHGRRGQFQGGRRCFGSKQLPVRMLLTPPPPPSPPPSHTLLIHARRTSSASTAS